MEGTEAGRREKHSSNKMVGKMKGNPFHPPYDP
jgi:hypothetical protein